MAATLLAVKKHYYAKYSTPKKDEKRDLQFLHT